MDKIINYTPLKRIRVNRGRGEEKGKREGGGDVAINELRIHTVVLIITDVDLSLLLSVNHQYTGH